MSNKRSVGKGKNTGSRGRGDTHNQTSTPSVASVPAQNTCPKCGTKVGYAPGIGEFCPNMKCDVKDGLDLIENTTYDYDSFEKQILDLWESRGLVVIEEKFRVLGKDKFSWTIIARRKL